jgi:hypothetical protein
MPIMGRSKYSTCLGARVESLTVVDDFSADTTIELGEQMGVVCLIMVTQGRPACNRDSGFSKFIKKGI